MSICAFGATIPRLASNCRRFMDALLLSHAEWADLIFRIPPPSDLRRWLRAAGRILYCDGNHALRSLSREQSAAPVRMGPQLADRARLNDLLLLHAGALERDGLALLLPAVPGSGKSTLTAALSLTRLAIAFRRVRRLRSAQRRVPRVIKPVALKNQSIDVIRRFAPEAGSVPVSRRHAKARSRTWHRGRCCGRRHEGAASRRRRPARSGRPGATTSRTDCRRTRFPRAGLQRLQLRRARRGGFHVGGASGSPLPGLAAWCTATSDDALALMEGAWARVVERHATGQHDVGGRGTPPPYPPWRGSGLREPHVHSSWRLAEWERVVRSARRRACWHDCPRPVACRWPA